MAILNCADLIRSGRDISVPFQIEITTGSGNGRTVVLEISHVFRLMPGNRLVGLTTWEEEPAIIKLFFQPRHWQRHLDRERRGNRHLMDARVSTPPLLETGNTADGKGALLLTKYLVQAESLENMADRGELVWNGSARSLLEKLIALLGRCHEQGIWQEDIHLSNFLLKDGRIYFLDGADVNAETPGAALGEASSLNNLAWFFAQFPVAHDEGVAELYQYYCQCRTARQFEATPAVFLTMVRDARRQRLENYRKKLLRSTSAHVMKRTAEYMLVADRRLKTAELDNFVADPDACIARGKIIKAGNTCTVALIELDGKQFVVKRYNLKNFLHRLKRMVTRSRAEKSWCSGLLLQMLGVGTARPLFMLEQRFAGLLRGKSYLVAEFVAGDDVQKLLAAAPDDAWLVDGIMDSFARLLVIMQDYQFTHGDMKATNFIYSGNKMYVLDLDGMIWHRKPAEFFKAFSRDLQRFLKNWKDQTGMEDVAHKAHNVVRKIRTDNRRVQTDNYPKQEQE